MPVNKNPTVKETVKEYLEKNGYDGLFNEDNECACFSDDLFRCDGYSDADQSYCQAGYKRILDDKESEFYGLLVIGPEKGGK